MANRAVSILQNALASGQARPAWAAGVRAGVAMAAPLLVAETLRVEGATWILLAAFMGAVADKGGPYRVRAASVAAVTVACAIAVGLGTLAGTRLAIAVPATLLFALACGLARVAGSVGVSLAISTLNTFVIALAVPSTDPLEALHRSVLVLAGGIWAMVLSLLLWPLRPFRPVRAAVAACHRELAIYAGELRRSIGASAAPPGREPRAGSPRVRVALEAAGAALALLRRGRAGESGRAERLLVLRESVDQQLGHLLALADVILTVPRDRRDRDAQAILDGTLEALARTASEVASAIEVERGTPVIDVAWSGEALRRRVSSPEVAEREYYLQAALLLDRMAQYARTAAVNAAALNDGRAAAPAASIEADLPDAPTLGATLQAVLSPDAVVLRHALRVAAMTSLAVAVTGLLGLPRGYWVTITVVIILQPYTGATGQKALQRIAGTVLGGLITAALGSLFHDPREILLLSFVFSIVAVALLPVNYAAYSVFLTPTFVLLAEATEGNWHLAWVRVLNTLLGGALALLGARFLWPHPERRRLPAALAAVMQANLLYLRETVDRFDDRTDAAALAMRRARRAVALALANAEESFQRLLAEYGGPVQELSPIMTLLTYSRRLTASLAALALSRHADQRSDLARVVPLASLGAPVLEDLAEALERGRPPEPLPPPGSFAPSADDPLLRARLERIARQLKTLHDAAARWVELDRAGEASPGDGVREVA